MDTTSKRKMGLRIRKERLLLRMSQDDLADALEMKSKAHISQWENGRRMPSPKYMMRLASLFKKLEAELFYELRMDAVRATERYHQRVQAKELQAKKSNPP